MPTFADLRLLEPIVRALREAGQQKPLPIQHRAIPPLLQGRDVLAAAGPGGGKTLAVAAAVLHLLTERAEQAEGKAPRALLLAPDREQAEQLGFVLESVGRYLRLRQLIVADGSGWNRQVAALRGGVELLIATPRRLLELLRHRAVNLRAVEIAVLDGADRMLDLGQELELDHLLLQLPERRQTALLTATTSPALAELADGWLAEPVRVDGGGTRRATTPAAPAKPTKGRPAAPPPEPPADAPAELPPEPPAEPEPPGSAGPPAPPVETIEVVLPVLRADKPALLLHLLREPGVRTALVFVRDTQTADEVVAALQRERVQAMALHSDTEPAARARAFEAFGSGSLRALVATDLAARVLELPGASLVVHYDLPRRASDFPHRERLAGRACVLCAPEERRYVRTVEHVLGYGLPVQDEHPFAGAAAGAGKTRAAKKQAPRRGKTRQRK